MKTESMPVDSLKPDPGNARRHNETNIRAIMKSLERFGQQKPIVVDQSGTVVAGNGFLEAARRLGWQDVVVTRTKLTGTGARAYSIADNRTTDLSDWDDAILQEALNQIRAEEEALAEAAGFGLDDDTEVDAPAHLESISTKAPPKMAWVLIGIPTARFGEIADLVETIGAVDGAEIETQLGD